MRLFEWEEKEVPVKNSPMKNRALSHAISLAAIALSMSIAQAGEIVPKVHAFSSETPAQRRLASQSVDGNCLLNGKHQISNACETLNSQIKRRTRVVGLFPNEDSLLRLVSAVLIEISETWETGKSYLNLNEQK